ncbi:MAG: amidohydrolase [Proteobacteria bacterium]|nr:amidohydrolase [Pseudomonadota bacterium]
MRRLRLLFAVAALALASTAAQAAGPELLVRNVRGYTLTAQGLARFDGLLVANGRVVEAGSGATLGARHPKARVVDGHGQVLLPGLIDAHGHVLELGQRSVAAELVGTRSLAEAQEQLRAYATRHTQQRWIRGGGWNQEIWRLGRFPTASELDAAISDRPAALARVDGHALWVNTRALRAAGITRVTADPSGGRIEHDASGEPSGVLVDAAMELVEGVAPPPTDAERRAAVVAALRHMNSVGLTGADDAGADAKTIAVYRALADRGQLSARLYVMILGVGADFHALAAHGPLLGYGHDRLTVRAVKLLADGALGSRGAAMLAPYSDDPGNRGLLFESDAAMLAKVSEALKAGYQVNIHAIGDAANRQVLNAFEAAYATVGGRPLRNRIEHAQIVDPADIPRFRTLDLVASMQPTHATSDMNMAEHRIGATRLAGAYAWRTFLDQGTRIAAGSDFPVESDNPFFGFYSAVTRMDHDGQPVGGWLPGQRMTRLEAFRAFTLDAAYARHQEDRVGSLEPGKWADFILVDTDPFEAPEASLWKTRVLETWVGGRRVY